MTQFPFETELSPLPNLALVVLQTDETIEPEFRRMFPPDRANLYVTRIPSGVEVTTNTLADMANTLPASVRLLPKALHYKSVGYGCTSGASVIGPERIADMVTSEAATDTVTDPVSALIDACRSLQIRRLAFLTPYVAEVSQTLRDVLAKSDIATPVFGSFNEADDATVAKISRASIMDAAHKLAASGDVDGLFMSCTNLKTIDLVEELETQLDMPVMSSNLVLARHLGRLSGVIPDGPNIALFRT